MNEKTIKEISQFINAVDSFLGPDNALRCGVKLSDYVSDCPEELTKIWNNIVYAEHELNNALDRYYTYCENCEFERS